MSRFQEFTLAEAVEIATRNDPGKDVPSVSRVLLAHIDALTQRAAEMEAQRDDYLNREWVATKAKQAAEQRVREVEAMIATQKMRAERKRQCGLKVEASIDEARIAEIESALTGSGSADNG